MSQGTQPSIEEAWRNAICAEKPSETKRAVRSAMLAVLEEFWRGQHTAQGLAGFFDRECPDYPPCEKHALIARIRALP